MSSLNAERPSPRELGDGNSQNLPSARARKSPLRVQFVITSLPVGGAETLLLSLIRRIDRQRFAPEVVCLKEPGALGDEIAREVPLHSNLLDSKWDVSVLFRLTSLYRQQATDAVVTIGAGDKMFWGRLAAWRAGVPVVCSALHSTGWPDGVGRLNRMLSSITDGFIACAHQHAEHLARQEGFPSDRVFMIPNGVDTERFRPNHALRGWLRQELSIPSDSPVVGIVAALRPEKNHLQLVEAAQEVLRQHPETHFLIVGEGPERAALEARIDELELRSHFHLLGNRSDTPRLLAGMDVFCLTSRNEANPVSILEALSCGVPVVSPDVGSISETVLPKKTGLLTKPLCADSTADAIIQLLDNPTIASGMGLTGRQLVRGDWSLDAMVTGYENLLATLYNAKAEETGRPPWQPDAQPVETPAAPRSDLPADAVGDTTAPSNPVVACFDSSDHFSHVPESK